MDNPATQQIQPDEFATFTHDRGGLKNYLQNMTPRTGKTQLYAAVQKAVEKTAEAALQQSSEAVVLVVSDGGDAISGDAFNEITRQAGERGVTIITFGFGTEEALENNEFRLSQLAEITDGMYRREPDAQAVKEVFENVVQVTPSGFYSVRYETELLEDDSQHTVRIEVGNVRSQEISFAPTRGANNSESDLKPLRNVLLWKYFIFALPASLLASLIITLTMGGIKVAKSRSLSRDRTRR
jgi:methylmalonyl-CoA mutase cobalamin-binding subunit